MINFFKKLFNKKTDVLIETEIENDVIKNNVDELINPTAMIIQYVIEDVDSIPQIKKICNFHNELMPDINSIIWAPNEAGNTLIPYKVIRFDFIEDPVENISNYTYIVVIPAAYTDIIK